MGTQQRSLVLGNNVIITESNYTAEHGVKIEKYMCMKPKKHSVCGPVLRYVNTVREIC